MTLASVLSLWISSSTEETITPAFLLGGSETWIISKSLFNSTFKSCGLNFLMGFDFAFIMFGSVAYLGWFNLKSVLYHIKKKQTKTNKFKHTTCQFPRHHPIKLMQKIHWKHNQKYATNGIMFFLYSFHAKPTFL